MIVIAYDSLDNRQGNYFSLCALELQESLPIYLADKFEILNGANLNFLSIEVSLNKINTAPYIFTAFCHGTSSSLNAQQIPFLKCKGNIQLLKNSLIYTNSCASGKEFGVDSIENGALAFIGYMEDVESLIQEEFLKTSIRCDNYALHFFLHNEVTLKIAVQKAKEWFLRESKRVVMMGNPLAAAILAANGRALIVHGDGQLTMKSLFNN